jgi:DNA-binding transcriptional regulator YhcF (GntR family)
MRQITDAIAVGRLKAGEKLPSHRDLSEQPVIAPRTVKKAYDELELAGFLETQRGGGTFVCARLPQPDPVQQTPRVTLTGHISASLLNALLLRVSAALPAGSPAVARAAVLPVVLLCWTAARLFRGVQISQAVPARQ